MALNEGTSSDRMDVVFNDYLDGSIKSAERENQGKASVITFKQINRSNNGENSFEMNNP